MFSKKQTQKFAHTREGRLFETSAKQSAPSDRPFWSDGKPGGLLNTRGHGIPVRVKAGYFTARADAHGVADAMQKNGTPATKYQGSVGECGPTHLRKRAPRHFGKNSVISVPIVIAQKDKVTTTSSRSLVIPSTGARTPDQTRGLPREFHCPSAAELALLSVDRETPAER